MSRPVQEAWPQVTKSLPSAPVTSSSVTSRTTVRDNPEVGLELQTLPPAKTVSEFLFGDP